MSVSNNPQVIRCDGEACNGRTHLPIALRSSGGNAIAEGWLFIHNGSAWRHYCPTCTPGILAQQRETAHPDEHSSGANRPCR